MPFLTWKRKSAPETLERLAEKPPQSSQDAFEHLDSITKQDRADNLNGTLEKNHTDRTAEAFGTPTNEKSCPFTDSSKPTVDFQKTPSSSEASKSLREALSPRRHRRSPLTPSKFSSLRSKSSSPSRLASPPKNFFESLANAIRAPTALFYKDIDFSEDEQPTNKVKGDTETKFRSLRSLRGVRFRSQNSYIEPEIRSLPIEMLAKPAPFLPPIDLAGPNLTDSQENAADSVDVTARASDPSYLKKLQMWDYRPGQNKTELTSDKSRLTRSSSMVALVSSIGDSEQENGSVGEEPEVSQTGVQDAELNSRPGSQDESVLKSAKKDGPGKDGAADERSVVEAGKAIFTENLAVGDKQFPIDQNTNTKEPGLISSTGSLNSPDRHTPEQNAVAVVRKRGELKVDLNPETSASRQSTTIPSSKEPITQDNKVLDVEDRFQDCLTNEGPPLLLPFKSKFPIYGKPYTGPLSCGSNSDQTLTKNPAMKQAIAISSQSSTSDGCKSGCLSLATTASASNEDLAPLQEFRTKQIIVRDIEPAAHLGIDEALGAIDLPGKEDSLTAAVHQANTGNLTPKVLKPHHSNQQAAPELADHFSSKELSTPTSPRMTPPSTSPTRSRRSLRYRNRTGETSDATVSVESDLPWHATNIAEKENSGCQEDFEILEMTPSPANIPLPLTIPKKEKNRITETDDSVGQPDNSENWSPFSEPTFMIVARRAQEASPDTFRTLLTEEGGLSQFWKEIGLPQQTSPRFKTNALSVEAAESFAQSIAYDKDQSMQLVNEDKWSFQPPKGPQTPAADRWTKTPKKNRPGSSRTNYENSSSPNTDPVPSCPARSKKAENASHYSPYSIKKSSSRSKKNRRTGTEAKKSSGRNNNLMDLEQNIQTIKPDNCAPETDVNPFLDTSINWEASVATSYDTGTKEHRSEKAFQKTAYRRVLNVPFETFCPDTASERSTSVLSVDSDMAVPCNDE